MGLALTSCGNDGGDEAAAASEISNVSVSGDPGTAPEVTFDGEVKADEITSEVLTEGDGEEVESGDSVLSHIWIGNGFTKKKAYSTYDDKAPQLLTVDEKQLSKVFIEGFEGHTIGSRVLVAAPADEAFGDQGNPQLGIGNKDTVVIVIDLLSGVAEGPEGNSADAPAWAPTIVEKDGVPTGFDFKKTPAPNKKLRSATLIEGEGATVEKGQTIVVNYLGQTYGGKKPFDESYSTGQPASFPIGTGGVIQGWDQTLVGTTVGSRVVMAIPPDLGYGEQGNPQAGIKGTDTLYFVVDVLAAG
jgi:peptidylprolyl isomerase